MDLTLPALEFFIPPDWPPPHTLGGRPAGAHWVQGCAFAAATAPYVQRKAAPRSSAGRNRLARQAGWLAERPEARPQLLLP